jgi:hypothetical protein
VKRPAWRLRRWVGLLVNLGGLVILVEQGLSLALR